MNNGIMGNNKKNEVLEKNKGLPFSKCRERSGPRDVLYHWVMSCDLGNVFEQFLEKTESMFLRVTVIYLI